MAETRVVATTTATINVEIFTCLLFIWMIPFGPSWPGVPSVE